MVSKHETGYYRRSCHGFRWAQRAYRKLSRIVDEIDPLDTVRFCGLRVLDRKLVINDESAKRLYALIADDNPSISSERSILVFLLRSQMNFYKLIRTIILFLFYNVTSFCISQENMNKNFVSFNYNYQQKKLLYKAKDYYREREE